MRYVTGEVLRAEPPTRLEYKFGMNRRIRLRSVADVPFEITTTGMIASEAISNVG